MSAPPVVKDSRKPWAVLTLIANSGQVLPQQTRYFWTRWGARRYATNIGDGVFYRLKVVSNR